MESRRRCRRGLDVLEAEPLQLVDRVADDAALLAAEAAGVGPGGVADDSRHQQMALQLRGQQLDAVRQLAVDLRQPDQVLACRLPHLVVGRRLG